MKIRTNINPPKRGDGSDGTAVGSYRPITTSRAVGFFYETQINEGTLNCTLHANSYVSKINERYTADNKKLDESFTSLEWEYNQTNTVQVEQGEGSGYYTKESNKDFNGKAKNSQEVDDDGYFKKALCRSIASEDFQVAISNSWQDFAGGNQISELFNQIRPIGAYYNWAKPKIEKIVAQTEAAADTSDSGSWGGKVLGGMVSVLRGASNIGNGLAKILGRSLVVQGTRFSYYCGTGISMGNLGMRFTLFGLPGFNVHKQLEGLYPYMIGKYVRFDVNENIFGGDENGDDSEEANPSAQRESFNELAQEFIGWQLPPGGFEPNIKDIDDIQKGTLKLKFGTYYSIPNLLIRDVTLNFSKQMMKSPAKGNLKSVGAGLFKLSENFTESQEHWMEYKPISDGGLKTFNQKKTTVTKETKRYRGLDNELSPLFCDVQIQFQPSTKFSDESMKRFVDGSRSGTDLTKIHKTMKDCLVDEAKLSETAFEKVDQDGNSWRDRPLRRKIKIPGEAALLAGLGGGKPGNEELKHGVNEKGPGTVFEKFSNGKKVLSESGYITKDGKVHYLSEKEDIKNIIEMRKAQMDYYKSGEYVKNNRYEWNPTGDRVKDALARDLLAAQGVKYDIPTTEGAPKTIEYSESKVMDKPKPNPSTPPKSQPRVPNSPPKHGGNHSGNGHNGGSHTSTPVHNNHGGGGNTGKNNNPPTPPPSLVAPAPRKPISPSWSSALPAYPTKGVIPRIPSDQAHTQTTRMISRTRLANGNDMVTYGVFDKGKSKPSKTFSRVEPPAKN